MRGRIRSAPSLRPRKSLGQHFLRDENIARKIVRAIDPAPADVFLEIGPGEGALTRHLAPGVRILFSVELDARAVDALQTEFPQDSVRILHQDFLATDMEALAAMAGAPLRVAGNIPYNITTPILFHLLDHRPAVRDATLMMQREVARRLVASPGSGEYGILSVFSQVFSDVRLWFDVSPTCFVPAPKVMSSVVNLRMLPAPRHEILDERFFRALVRGVFGKRRKTLRNSLGYFLGEPPSAEMLPPGFDQQRRPEELSIAELVRLSNTLFSQKHRGPKTQNTPRH